MNIYISLFLFSLLHNIRNGIFKVIIRKKLNISRRNFWYIFKTVNPINNFNSCILNKYFLFVFKSDVSSYKN